MGRPTPVRGDMVSTVSALQAHIETLKAELAASEARVDKLSTELAGEAGWGERGDGSCGTERRLMRSR